MSNAAATRSLRQRLAFQVAELVTCTTRAQRICVSAAIVDTERQIQALVSK